MSAIAEMVHHSSLGAEWKRIEILAQCLLEARSGREPDEPLIQQLKESQHQVEFLRKDKSLWDKLPLTDLSPLALDLLAVSYAPFSNPNVALLYQDLQQSSSIYPGLAFIYRLLALNDQEYHTVQRLLERDGELLTRGLLQVEGEGPLLQIKPHPSVMSVITGLPQRPPQIPGAVLIKIPARWDELIIPASQLTMLKEYLLWIHHADKVVNEWGGRPCGGPIALFSGPSGTGKTFAASVIANELGWLLYRVDLGSLISKYIGETEKNLNALFDAVQGQNILLQFDEVDALMGKRGEIRDARDRYANMEVSHLLSRIEQHQGPCILTTNLRKQIDPAFQRRFHFVMTFPRPEASERLALWQKLLPENAPLERNLDLPLIAEAVALSGGEIRNAANHAAILAAAQNSPITMPLIAIGIWRVLQKSDGQTRSNQLRQLLQYLPADIISGEPNDE